MTAAQNGDGRDSSLCGGRTRAGGSCRRPAGWGTDHPCVPGTRCKLHGGSTPTHQPAAERAAAEQIAAQFGLELDGTPPGEIILREIGRASAMVKQLVAYVGELPSQDLIWGITSRKVRKDADGQQVVEVKEEARQNIWIVMLREERVQLRELIVAAHRAGIEDRQIALMERSGELISAAFWGLLGDLRAAWHLDGGQVEEVKALIARRLNAIGDGENMP
jgi:hypothetical protein